MLTDFQNFCTAEKRKKFATKPTWQCPPHLRHVVTLPWEIKTSNFLPKANKQIAFLIASTCGIHPQILTFSEFKIANLSSYCIANIIFHVTGLLLICFGDQFVASEIRHRRRVTAVFVNNQHDIKRRGKILIQSLYLKAYTAKRLTDEFPEKLDKAWC